MSDNWELEGGDNGNKAGNPGKPLLQGPRSYKDHTWVNYKLIHEKYIHVCILFMCDL